MRSPSSPLHSIVESCNHDEPWAVGCKGRPGLFKQVYGGSRAVRSESLEFHIRALMKLEADQGSPAIIMICIPPVVSM